MMAATAEGVDDELPPRPLAFSDGVVELPFVLHALVQRRSLRLQLLFGDVAGEHDPVVGELLRAEVAVEEVEDEDEARRQQGFVTVDDVRDVDHPTRQHEREERGEPQDQTERPITVTPQKTAM